MWENDIYLIPIAAILNMYKLREDTHLEGKLSEEFQKLVSDYISASSFEISVDPSVTADICCDYPKGTCLGLVLLDIVGKFSLSHEVNATSDMAVHVTFKEGSNGRVDSEP